MTDYSQYNDNELLRELQCNHESALVALYNRYWDKMFVVAANLLNQPEEAEECVQNVFLSLWKRRQKLQLRYSLHTYLTVSVKYQSITRLARAHRRSTQEDWNDTFDVVEADSPEALYIAKELQRRIEQSINRLPTQCQLVFRMSRENGMSARAIAEELQLSENTIKMHLKNATKKLKGDLLIFIPAVFELFYNKIS